MFTDPEHSFEHFLELVGSFDFIKWGINWIIWIYKNRKIIQILKFKYLKYLKYINNLIKIRYKYIYKIIKKNLILDPWGTDQWGALILLNGERFGEKNRG